MTPARLWEKWIYMVKRLVSISIPIVHHVSNEDHWWPIPSKGDGVRPMRVGDTVYMEQA